jgi:hypothetical protein
MQVTEGSSAQAAPALGCKPGQPGVVGGPPQAQVGFASGMQAPPWQASQLQTVPSGKPHETSVVQLAPLSGGAAGQPFSPGSGQIVPVVMSSHWPLVQVYCSRHETRTLSP